MDSILLETIMLEAGSADNGFGNRLMSNAEFSMKFRQMKSANLALSRWANSHVSMDGVALAFEKEKARLQIPSLHNELVSIAKSILINTELREFELSNTEHFSNLSVREVFSKLENGEIASIPTAA